MKKILSLLILTLSLFALAACDEALTENLSIEAITLNEDGEWEIAYEDGTSLTLPLDSSLVSDVEMVGSNTLRITFDSGYTEDVVFDFESDINYHMVTFLRPDGLIHDVQFIASGESATSVEGPNKLGHTFLEWDQDLSSIDEDLIVEGVYEVNTIVISFETNIEGVEYAPQTIDFNTRMTAPNVRSDYPEGYTLEGIYYDADFTQRWNRLDYQKESTTLYYHWIPIDQFYTEDVFNEVLELLKKNHYKDTTDATFYQFATYALIEALNDPYTSYMTQSQREQFNNVMGEDFVGVGITVENINEDVIIRQVWPDSPAEGAGLRAGDRITYIDEINVENMSYVDTVMLLLGEINTVVEIGVARSGFSEPLFFTMTRARIPNPSVEYEIYEYEDAHIGHLKIRTFGQATAGLVNEALAAFDADPNITGVIVDVRYNGGGALNAVFDILDAMLPITDKPLFSTYSTHLGQNITTEYHGGVNPPDRDYEFVVLVNEFSASASEVLAAAMQEHGGYSIIGMETLGKGTMQIPIRISNGSDIQTTIGQWFTPDNNWIHQDEGDFNGVIPDIEVDRNPFFNAFNIYLRDGESLVFDTVSDANANAQVILQLMGYDIRTDGYFDQNMVDIILDIQEENDLAMTGEIDADTAEFLSDTLLSYIRNLDNDLQLQTAINYFLED